MGGFAVILLLAFTLIGAIMLRPWAGPDKSWRTHMNLTEEPYSDYNRSVQAFVSPEGGAPILVWSLSPCDGEGATEGRGPFVVEAAALAQNPSEGGSWDVDNSSCSEPGRAEFVAHGCASCHGLEAQGSAVAPPVAGQKESIVEFHVRRGPDGMPSFSEEELSPEHLKAIIAYLSSLEPIVEATETTPTATPTPIPVQAATPMATAAAPPLVPLAEIAYDSTWPQWYLTQGKQLFQSNCTACHDLPTIESIKAFASDGNVVETTIAMAGFSGLSDEDAAKVIRYLLALRHGTAP